MSARLLLAAIILTNPICCQMFGSTRVLRAEEPIAECTGCACECGERTQPAPSSDEGKTPPRPCDCPNCELCQCVCAGAVVVDIVTVADMDGRTLIDAIAEHAIHLSSLFPHEFSPFGTLVSCGEANVGRAARILQASLLC